MARPITMEQVARELGLSRRVVSSVVNNKARERGVRPETEERVRAYLKESGFVPSAYARGLRMGAQETVGILYGGHLYSHLTDGFNRIVDHFNQTQNGVSVKLAPRDAVEQGLQDLISQGVRYLVWLHAGPFACETNSLQSLLPYLLQFEKRIVYNYRFEDGSLDAFLRQKQIYMVGVDRSEGFRKLGNLLNNLGHKRVIIPHPERAALSMGALRAFKAAGIDCICCNEYGATSVEKTNFKKLAAEIKKVIRNQGITAACFVDDEIAGNAMTALLSQGIRIPEDLTVTGFDGLPLAGSFAVPLTTLSVPVEKMAGRVKRIIRGELKRFRQCCNLELIERESHGSPRMDRSGS